jgi:hypothetical protein
VRESIATWRSVAVEDVEAMGVIRHLMAHAVGKPVGPELRGAAGSSVRGSSRPAARRFGRCRAVVEAKSKRETVVVRGRRVMDDGRLPLC